MGSAGMISRPGVATKRYPLDTVKVAMRWTAGAK